MLLGADAADTLEGGAEREGAAVADLVGDGADRGAGFERHRFGVVVEDPCVAADHRHDGERGLVLDPQRPRRVHARTQEERRSGTWSVEQACHGVHVVKPRRCGRSQMELRV